MSLRVLAVLVPVNFAILCLPSVTAEPSAPLTNNERLDAEVERRRKVREQHTQSSDTSERASNERVDAEIRRRRSLREQTMSPGAGVFWPQPVQIQGLHLPAGEWSVIDVGGTYASLIRKEVMVSRKVSRFKFRVDSEVVGGAITDVLESEFKNAGIRIISVDAETVVLIAEKQTEPNNG
jgi:hypothetical protein